MRGPWPVSCLAKENSLRAESVFDALLLIPHATWSGPVSVLEGETWFTQNECAAENTGCLFGVFVCCVPAPPSSWSWASVVYVVCLCVVGWVVGRVGCLSLLVTKSLSIEFHFEPSFFFWT